MRARDLGAASAHVAAQLGVEPGRLCAIHELVPAVLGVDNYLEPCGLDYLVAPGSVPAAWGLGRGRSAAGDAFHVAQGGPRAHTVRLWESVGGLALGDAPQVEAGGYTGRLLDPAVALDLMPLSPDFRLLYEQRAALAELLYFDRMPREQLAEFVRYVRL